MIRVVDDVDAVADAFLAHINTCFGGWGDAEQFDWCFRRSCGGPVADLIVAEEVGAMVAGAAVTWRALARGDVGLGLIGCLGSAWTDAAWRGRGLFGAIAGEAARLARRRGAAGLIAFVTEGRRSAAALDTLADAAVPGAFLTAPEASGTATAALPVASEGMARAVPADTLHIVYDDAGWGAQMLARPGADLLRLAGGRAAVQAAGSQLRLLDMAVQGSPDAAIAQLADHARVAGLALSLFTLDGARIAALTARGWASTACRMYVLAAQPALLGARWHIANGDRM